MRTINPAGEVVETKDVWWWQSEEGRLIAEVRAVCRRNALSEVAANSEKHEVHIAALGPIDIHRSQIMAVARWAKPLKWMVRRSYRVAKRRKCLMRLKQRSMRLRSL